MRRRRTLPATKLRIHLGEALRSLKDADIVIEKGGVPVALLTRYTEPPVAVDDAYEQAIARRGDPDAWPEAMKAMTTGWAGIDPDTLTADVRSLFRCQPDPSCDLA